MPFLPPKQQHQSTEGKSDQRQISIGIKSFKMTVTILAMTMMIKYQIHKDIKVMIKIMTAKNHEKS